MAKLRLNKFLTMNPDVPEYSTRNQNYLLSGIDPLYYLTQSTTQEQRSAPLAAAGSFTSVYTIPGGTGNVSYIAPSNYSFLYDLLAVTDQGTLYGVGGNANTSLGQPYGAASATPTGVTTSFAGMILYTDGLNAGVRYTTNFAGGGWADVTGTYGSAGGLTPKFLVPFLDFCAMADSPTGSGTSIAHSVVRKIDSSRVVSQALNLGLGWNIVGMLNYNNRYLAIVATYNGGNTTNNNNVTDVSYLFLWDGKSNTYNNAIKIPGLYLHMKLVNTTLFFAVQDRTGQHTLYQLGSNNITPVFNIGIDTFKTIAANTAGTNNIIFEYGNSVGMNLSTKGQLIYDPGTKAKYILTPTDNLLYQRASGVLYAALPNGSAITQFAPTTSYSPIKYQSQWIPFKDLSNIVVRYATPPSVNGDAIQVTLDGFDEDGTASTALPLTVISNTNFYNSYKTPLDTQGFQGDLVRITLTTTSAGTWRPIIREIELASQ